MLRAGGHALRMRNETWRLCSGQAEQAQFTTRAVDFLIRRPPLQQQLSRQAPSLRRRLCIKRLPSAAQAMRPWVASALIF